jgi:hypothetical protein
MFALTPSLLLVAAYNNHKVENLVMRKKATLQRHADPVQAEELKRSPNIESKEIEHEIECPRCHHIMTLSSEFDKLGYFCEECSFSLYLN